MRQRKLQALLELVLAPWFLGFVSRSFSGLNLLDTYMAVPGSYFYARVSNQNPNLVTIDYVEHEALPRGQVPPLVRVRLQAPNGQLCASGPEAGKLDPNWTMPLDLDPAGQPRLYYVDGAPTVTELIKYRLLG